MLSSKRLRESGVLGPIARTLIVAFTVSAAACSADVTRFDFGSRNTTSSLPVPPEPIRSSFGPGGTPRGLGVTETPLPPSSFNGDYNVASRPYNSPPPYSPPSYDPPNNYQPPNSRYGPPPYAANPPPPSEPPGNYRVVGRQYKSPPPVNEPPRLTEAPRRPYQQSGQSGAGVEVQPGETLFSIGRRYGVPVAAIKEANGLTDNTVRPGQRLIMPATRDRVSDARPPASDRTDVAAYTPPPATDRVETPKQPTLSAAAAPDVPPPPGWEGRYTMKNGDSLYGIALRHNVSVDELQRANGITDPTKVWAGTVLNVPGRSDTAATPAPPTTPPRVVTTVPRIINVTPGQKTAHRTDVANDAGRPGDAATTAKFRWPVRGRVIAGFGRRSDGAHNDGVNVAVPLGTAIHAAEAGKVAYAGNELKGYGNLVLIRHNDGWVSAYAHADQLLVRPNDEVRRGQIIAKVGKTGAVDQPQLHFELRQGSRPVDPVPYLGD